MLRNYLLIGLRNIFRQKNNSIINLAGLALGITVSLFIILYLNAELNYEKDFDDFNNIYRLASGRWAKSSPPASEAIMQYFPEINASGRLALFRGGTNVVIIEGTHQPIRNGYYSDQSIIDVFNLEVIEGNRNELLTRPFTLVLTKSVAKILFGNTNPVGESIKFGFGELKNAREYEITGLIDDFPEHSHLKINYLVSMPTFYEHFPDGWTQSKTWKVMYTYLKVDNKKEFSNIDARLTDFQYDHQVDENYTKENLDAYGDYFELNPIEDIHLNSHREQEMGPNGHIGYIYIFGALAMLIIIVASANFINLFITQSLKRNKEVGIRKVTGAYRSQLIRQFLLEAFLYTLISTIIGLILCSIALPVFNDIANQNFTYRNLFRPEHIQIVGLLVAIITLLAGGYPSVYISRFKIIESLKLNQLPRSSISNARRTLILVQFIIAIFMITSTLIISRQLEYFRNKDLGFDKDHVLAIYTYGDFSSTFQQNREYIYNEFKKHPGILKSGATSSFIGEINSVEFLLPEGREYDFEHDFMRFSRSDEGFIPAMGIEIIQGRNFNPVSDSAGAFIVNEKVVKMLELEEPVGTMAINTAFRSKGPIVGVMKDFNFASLHNEIEPLVLSYKPEWSGTIIVKLSGDQIKESLNYMEKIVQRIAPGSLFTYRFLDDQLNNMYISEDKMSRIFKIFSLLAILISCLGLYGLAAYSAELRTKEIGIRKAFGASVTRILILLSKVYISLIGIAFLITIPLSNYFITEWLKNFAYQTNIDWWVFALSGILTSIVALLAVSGKSLNAARTNPSVSLRSE